MPLNLVRGFRRIGWAVTLPLAAYIVIFLNDHTKDFAAYDMEAIASFIHSSWRIEDGKLIPIDDFEPVDDSKPVNKPDAQDKKFDLQPVQETPKYRGNDQEAIKGLVSLLEEERLTGISPKELSDLRASSNGRLHRKDLEIRRVNKAKLIGLIFGAIAGVAIVVQGSISIFVWILRGLLPNMTKRIFLNAGRSPSNILLFGRFSPWHLGGGLVA